MLVAWPTWLADLLACSPVTVYACACILLGFWRPSFSSLLVLRPLSLAPSLFSQLACLVAARWPARRPGSLYFELPQPSQRQKSPLTASEPPSDAAAPGLR